MSDVNRFIPGVEFKLNSLNVFSDRVNLWRNKKVEEHVFSFNE